MFSPSLQKNKIKINTFDYCTQSVMLNNLYSPATNTRHYNIVQCSTTTMSPGSCQDEGDACWDRHLRKSCDCGAELGSNPPCLGLWFHHVEGTGAGQSATWRPPPWGEQSGDSDGTSGTPAEWKSGRITRKKTVVEDNSQPILVTRWSSRCNGWTKNSTAGLS